MTEDRRRIVRRSRIVFGSLGALVPISSSIILGAGPTEVFVVGFVGLVLGLIAGSAVGLLAWMLSR
jgi:hypothetical protein